MTRRPVQETPNHVHGSRVGCHVDRILLGSLRMVFLKLRRACASDLREDDDETVVVVMRKKRRSVTARRRRESKTASSFFSIERDENESVLGKLRGEHY